MSFIMKQMIKQIIFYFTILIILIITGCEKIDPGETFISKVGDKERVSMKLSFTIESINDYRCPRDMVCVTSGDVETHIRFNQPFHHSDTVIYLYHGNQNPVIFGGYSFEVLDVTPYLKMNETASQEDYRIKMIVQRN